MLFIILSLIELLGELFNKNTLIIYTKPLLIPILYLETFYHNPQIKYPIIASIVFSTCGDYLLLWKHNMKYFLLGIFCFMGTQISYSIFFYQNSLVKCNWLLLGPTFILTQFILLKILNDIANNILKVIVSLYTMMVSFMFYTAMTYNNYLVFLGSSLFVVSDTLLGLGIDKKYKYQNLYNTMIMSTYLLGQYLILHNISQ
jgi:uncharacterized membrane protein YhhN